MRISEIILVNDCGPGDSDSVIRELADHHDVVRSVWLSRNYGQHAATLAGMASSGGDWICSLDEDGQHDPAFIPAMLDTALAERAAVVYAKPDNSPSHGPFRNATSAFAKWMFVNVLSSETQPGYHSYRLVLGEIGRSLAAYSGRGIYLDVALGWITQSFAHCPVELRDEGDRRSGYSTRSLASHFWRLVLTSGTRPMRIMSAVGAIFAFLGLIGATLVVVGRVTGRIDVEGWSSLAVVIMVGFGLVLFSLGIVAEYIGVTARMAMGQPPYLIVSDEVDGPLGDALRRSGPRRGGPDDTAAVADR
jgi:undecaprenyl-phosphate 4-deoxy-4-formamido-L-arabinose transferase